MRLKLTWLGAVARHGATYAPPSPPPLLVVHRRFLHARHSSNIPWLKPQARPPPPGTAAAAAPGPASTKPGGKPGVQPSSPPSSPGGSAVKGLFGAKPSAALPPAGTAQLLQAVQANVRRPPVGPIGRVLNVNQTAAQALMNSIFVKPKQGGGGGGPGAPPARETMEQKAMQQVQQRQTMRDQHNQRQREGNGYRQSGGGSSGGGSSYAQPSSTLSPSPSGGGMSARVGQFGPPGGSTPAASTSAASAWQAGGRAGVGAAQVQGRVYVRFGSSPFDRRAQKRAQLARGRAAAAKAKVVIADGMTPRGLALQMALPVGRVLGKLQDLGEEAQPDEPMDAEIAELIAQDAGMVVVRKDTRLADRVRTHIPPAEEMAKRGYPHRAPVVTVMGHVDHGKTTLLDALRGSNIAEREAGGITQGVAAFSVAMRAPHVAVGGKKRGGAMEREEEGGEGGEDAEAGRGRGKERRGKSGGGAASAPPTPPTPRSVSSIADVMTFLDTPGHALFSSMRRRGGSVTDVVVLVVDGKDGVMPQTKECVELITASGLPCIVAVTKCDVVDPASAVSRVGKQLLECGLSTTEFGGQVQAVPVSAKSGFGIQGLKDAIALEAEMLDIRADASVAGEAVVLDARMVQGQGQVVDCIVRWGSLKVGDMVVAGNEFGRIKALLTDATAAGSLNKRLMGSAEGGGSGGKKDKKGGEDVSNVFQLLPVKEVVSGTPVRLLGLKGSPDAGVDLLVVADEERAQAVLDGRARKANAQAMLAIKAADVVQRGADAEAYKLQRKKQAAYLLAVTRERRRGYLIKTGQLVPPDLLLQSWEMPLLNDPSMGRVKPVKGQRARQHGGQQTDVKLSFHTATRLAEAGESAPADAVQGPIPVAFIVKTDSSGSLAAVKDAIARIGEQVPAVLPRVVSSGVGEVTEKDVVYADEMKACILAFATKVSPPVQKAAERRKVTLKSSRVIYHLLDEVLEVLAGVLPPEDVEEVVAVAEVKAVFEMRTDKKTPGKVAGCVIIEGAFVRTASVYRVVRDGKVVGEGPLGSLQVLKEKVESVAKGKDCGIAVEGCTEYEVGDKVQAVKKSTARPKLKVRLD